MGLVLYYRPQFYSASLYKDIQMKNQFKTYSLLILCGLIMACVPDPKPTPQPEGECPADGSKENCNHAQEQWLDYPTCQCVIYGTEPTETSGSGDNNSGNGGIIR